MSPSTSCLRDAQEIWRPSPATTFPTRSVDTTAKVNVVIAVGVVAITVVAFPAAPLGLALPYVYAAASLLPPLPGPLSLAVNAFPLAAAAATGVFFLLQSLHCCYCSWQSCHRLLHFYFDSILL